MQTARKTPVMVTGITGNMGKLVAREIQKSPDFELFGHSMVGIKSGTSGSFDLNGQAIKLYNPAQRGAFVKESEFNGREGLVMDVTKDHAVFANGVFYVQNGWNFVMATTGGEVVNVKDLVRQSSASALFAPNLSMQIVALQKVLSDFADSHKDQLIGTTIKMVESHQAYKGNEPSGTAVNMSNSFGKMGVSRCPFNGADIKANPQKYAGIFEMVRDPIAQMALPIPVPQAHLGGHEYHTYSLTEVLHQDTLGELYSTLRNFLKTDAVFGDYSTAAFDNTKDGCSVTRIAPDQNALFRSELLLVPTGPQGEARMQVNLTHNVNGRGIYASGALPALRFLMDNKTPGQVFSMLDLRS